MKIRRICLWGVLSLTLMLPFLQCKRPSHEIPVTNEIQASVDYDGSGTLNNDEINELVILLRECLEDPGEVRSHVAELFDREKDNFLEPWELEEGRDRIFRDLQRLYEWDPHIAQKVDLNNNNDIELFEREELMRTLFYDREGRQNPRDVKNKNHVDRQMDLNKDGFIDEEEIDRSIETLYRAIVTLPGQWEEPSHREPGEPPEEPWEQGIAVRSEMDERLDINQNGRIEPHELEEIRQIFSRIEKRPHRVENDEDRFFDLNGNQSVEIEEIKQIGNYLMKIRDNFTPTQPDFQEEKRVENLMEELADINGDGIIQPNEYNQVRRAFRGPHKVKSEFDRRIDFNHNNMVEEFEIAKAQRTADMSPDKMEEQQEERVQTQTPVDAIFDLNDDGFIDEEEINIAVKLLTNPHRSDKKSKIDEIIDFNKNGFISEQELFMAREQYLQPHPVNPESNFDNRLDTNRNGFIEPEEIGVAAGFTGNGDLPTFEERIETVMIREESFTEYTEEMLTPEETSTPEETGTPTEEQPETSETPQKKMKGIKGKKIALMGFSSNTEDIDSNTSEAISVFIENAFVNIGTAKVVDRQNITKIISEYEFQQSDLSDESTAVKIGKLAGAEIIVIGNINYVGKKYYLNVKLISVETAEIIGSSISMAESDSEFYKMCNSGVSKLF